MALNRCTIQGNLCRDVELSQTNNGGTYLRNTIACQRNYSKEGQEKQSDFINIIAYVRLLGLDYFDSIHWFLCYSLVVHTINSVKLV